MSKAIYVSSVTNLRTYVDEHMGPDATPENVTSVTDAIWHGDHPAWGDDWSAFLDGLDLWSMGVADTNG